MKLHKLIKDSRGFTLIELLLVAVIIGILLVVIVPKALRARIDAKYGLVRQNASELAAFGTQWAEKAIQAQDEVLSTATVSDYFATLAGQQDAPATGAAAAGEWVANQARPSSWNLLDGDVANRDPRPVTGRYMDGAADVAPEDCVEDVVPPDKVIRNPFTEVSVFRDPNDPDTQGGAITGAVALGGYGETAEGNFVYYAFCFQGTDNTVFALTDEHSFHAGSDITSLAGLRNGIFLARVR